MTSTDRPESPTPTAAMLERTRRRAEQMRRRRRGALAGVVVAVVAIAVPLVLADANHPGHILRTVGEPTSLSVAPTTPADTAPTSSSLPPGTTPAATAPAGTATPTVPRTTTTRNPVVVKECATSQLNATLTNPSGAAGSVGYDLSFANVSAVACSLGGFPGVSFVTGANGTPVGAAAQRDNFGPIATVVVAPGHTARAILLEVDSGNFPARHMQARPGQRIEDLPAKPNGCSFRPAGRPGLLQPGRSGPQDQADPGRRGRLMARAEPATASSSAMPEKRCEP